MGSQSNKQCNNCFFYFKLGYEVDAEVGRCMNHKIPLPEKDAIVIGDLPINCKYWEKRKGAQIE